MPSYYQSHPTCLLPLQLLPLHHGGFYSDQHVHCLHVCLELADSRLSLDEASGVGVIVDYPLHLSLHLEEGGEQVRSWQGGAVGGGGGGGGGEG